MPDSPFSSKEDGSAGEKSQQQDIHYKQPDYILIDDRPQSRRRTRFNSKGEPAGSDDVRQPFPLRLLCFLGFLLCTVLGMGLFLFALLMTVIAAFCFFRNPEINHIMNAVWRLFSNILVAAVGCLAGIIFPALGISLMAIYFSLSGEKASSDLLKAIVKRIFNVQ